MSMEIKRLDPLFNNEREYKEFTERHNKDCVKREILLHTKAIAI